MENPTAPLLIRSAEGKDVAPMLAVYAPYITHTAVTFEYEVPDEEEFLSRVQTVQRKYPWLVAE